MMHSSYAIQVVQRIVDLLALFADKGLYETAVIVDANHRRDVALQLRHLAGSPRREVAESHLVALADDIVQFIEYLEVDVVNLLHLVLKDFGLHHRVEQHLVRTFECCQYVHTFHEVGHADVVVTLCLLLASLQQLLVQQIVRMLRIELDLVDING